MIGITSQIIKNQFPVKKNRKKKLPNSIITFFLILQFVSGFHFGFINVLNKKIRNFCKLITLLICLYNSIILVLLTPIFVPNWDNMVFLGSMIFVQYCGHIILLYFPKYKVYNFVTDVRSIDDGVIYSKEHIIGRFACIMYGFTFVITVMLSIVVCIVTNSGCMLDNSRVNAIYMISVNGLDAIVLVQMVVNFYAYYAVNYLVKLVGREETSLIRKQFLRVSECCEKLRGHYGSLVSIDFIVAPSYVWK